MSAQFFAYSGLHYKTCPVELREILAKSYHIQHIDAVIRKIMPQSKIEFVPVNTCNRFDISFFGKINKTQILEIYLELFRIAQAETNLNLKLNFEFIEKYLRIELDQHALRMLFKIASSLDSLVIGESQILGQLKNAFLEAVEHNFANTIAVPIFNTCIRVAKKVRAETEIGKNSISIGSAAIDLISRIFENLFHKKILIIGTGEMGCLAAKHILDKNANEIFIASRSYVNAEKLAFELGKGWPLELSDATSRIAEFDICIVAAAGSEFIVKHSDLKDYAKKRYGKHSIFIDLSVPRKIEPSISDIENLFLFNIDDIDVIIDQNVKNRKSAAQLAEQIIEEQVHEYMVLHKQKENLSNVGKFHVWIKNLINSEVDRYNQQLKNGKKEDPAIIADVIAKKIVAHSAYLAKNNIKTENVNDSVGDLLEFLFNLSKQSLPEKKNIEKSNVLIFPKRKNIR